MVSEMKRDSVISLLDRPFTSAVSTSCSRGEERLFQQESFAIDVTHLWFAHLDFVSSFLFEKWFRQDFARARYAFLVQLTAIR